MILDGVVICEDGCLDVMAEGNHIWTIRWKKNNKRVIEKGNLIEVINIILKKTENKIVKEGEWIIWCWVIRFELNFNDIWLDWAKNKMGLKEYEGNCVIVWIFWCMWWKKKKSIY